MRSFVLTFLLLPVVGCTNFLDLGGNDAKRAPLEPAAAKAQNETSTQTTEPAALTAYCAARADWTKTCSSLSECGKERSKQCSDVFSVYRNEYLTALTTCGFPSECSASITTDAIDTCVVDATDKIAPTAEQQKLATDLCAVCPSPGGGECLDGFFNHGRRNPDGSYTVGGQGSSFDMYEESVVAKIRTACLPDVKAAGTSSCWPALYSCIDQQIAAVQPGSVAKACPVDGAPIAPNE